MLNFDNACIVFNNQTSAHTSGVLPPEKDFVPDLNAGGSASIISNHDLNLTSTELSNFIFDMTVRFSIADGQKFGTQLYRNSKDEALLCPHEVFLWNVAAVTRSMTDILGSSKAGLPMCSLIVQLDLLIIVFLSWWSYATAKKFKNKLLHNSWKEVLLNSLSPRVISGSPWQYSWMRPNASIWSRRRRVRSTPIADHFVRSSMTWRKGVFRNYTTSIESWL